MVQKLSLKEEGVEERAQDVVITPGKKRKRKQGLPGAGSEGEEEEGSLGGLGRWCLRVNL